MKIFLEDKQQYVELPDGLNQEQMEAEVRKHYTPDELYGKTTFAERETYRVQKGRAVVDDGLNWHQAMMGQKSYDDANNVSFDINKDFTEDNDNKFQARNWPERFVGATTELAPYMMDSAIEGMRYGEYFGAAGASAAIVGGQVGPQAFLPEELITVPAAYIGGKAVGQAYGTWMQAAKVEGGHLYRGMIEDGIAPEVARNFAVPAGYAIGAIELLQIEKLIPGFGKEGIASFIKNAAKRGSGNKIKEAIKTIGRFGKELAGVTAIETAQEIVQETIGLTAEVGAAIYKDMADEEGYSGPDYEEARDRMQQTIVQSLLGFPLLGLPRTIHSTVSLHNRDKFIQKALTRKAQESLDNELAEVVEKATEYDSFDEFAQDMPEEIDDNKASELGFDNRALLEEQVWNMSRDVVSEDKIIDQTIEGELIDASIDPIPPGEESVEVFEDTEEDNYQLSQVEKDIEEANRNLGSLRKLSEQDPEEIATREEVADMQEYQDMINKLGQFKDRQKKVEEYSGIKIRMYEDGYLKEEMAEIPKRYITNKKTAETLDELADSKDMTIDELIEDIKTAEVKREDIENAKGYRQRIKEIERKSARKNPKYREAIEARIRKPQRRMVREASLLKRLFQERFKGEKIGAKEKEADLRDIKQGIVDTIKQYLPVQERGKFLTMVANAKTGRDIFKVMSRLERVVEEFEKKQLVQAIRKEVKKIGKSKSIAVDYVQRIEEFIDDYSLKGFTQKTLDRLLETQRYLESEADAGRDIQIPKHVLESLRILARKPLKDLNTATLKDIYFKIKSMESLGRTKLRSRLAVEKMRKAYDLAQIQQDSKPITSKKIKEGNVVEGRLNPIDKFMNTVKSTMNLAQEKDLAITPMDVVFDLLDGSKGYVGANYRIFKKRLDEAFSSYLDSKDALFNKIDALSARLNLTEDNMDRIGIYAAKVQEGGMEKLLTFFTQKQVDSIVLTAEEMQFYKAMRKELDEIRPKIEKTMREVYNEPLGEVKNYFPFMMDFESMSDYEIRERFGDNVEMYSDTLKKNVNKDFTKDRVKNARYKLKLNAAEIFGQHVDNAYYLIHVGRESKYLGDIAQRQEYGEAVGDVGQEVVREWIDLIARKGKGQGDRVRLIDNLRNYTGVVALGYKLSSMMIQVTALADGAALIGPKAFTGFSKIVLSSKWRNFVFDYMPEVRDRVGDDPAFMGFTKKGWKTLTNTAYLGLKTLDRITATGVAVGAYMKYAEDNGIPINVDEPNVEAINYAQKIVRRTQSSAQFKDLPMAISKGKLTGNISVDKMILQFQSFMLNRWSLIRHDLWRAGIFGGKQKQAISVAMWILMANFLEMGIRDFSKETIAALFGQEIEEDDDEDREMQKKLGVFLGNIPFVSSFYYSILYDDLPVPSLSMLGKIITKLSYAAQTDDDETRVKNIQKAVINAIPGLSQFERQLVPNEDY